MMAYLRTKPYLLQPGEGPRRQSSGISTTVKANSEETDGAFNLFDVTCQPGYATPLHIHYAEDVMVCVLEGTLAFFWGSEKKEAVAGSCLFQPRGTPHGFRANGEAPTRILYLTFPAGLDRLVVEQELQAPISQPAATAARYKIEVLGPLPD